MTSNILYPLAHALEGLKQKILNDQFVGWADYQPIGDELHSLRSRVAMLELSRRTAPPADDPPAGTLEDAYDEAVQRIADLEAVAAELSLWVASIHWDGSRNTGAWLGVLRERNARMQKMLPDLHGMEIEE